MTTKDPYEIMWTSEVTLARGGFGPIAVRYSHLGPAEAKIDGQGHLHLQTVAGADFEIEFALHLVGTFTAWAQTPDEQFGVELSEGMVDPDAEEPIDVSYESTDFADTLSIDELRRGLTEGHPAVVNSDLAIKDEPEGSEYGD
jgi:hypothetical protein